VLSWPVWKRDSSFCGSSSEVLGATAGVFSAAQQAIEKNRILYWERLARDSLKDTSIWGHARRIYDRFDLDDKRHLLVIEFKDIADLEARNRLQPSEDLANPKAWLLGGRLDAIQPPSTVLTARADDQVAANLIGKAACCLSQRVGVGVALPFARALRLPRHALLAGIVKKGFDMRTLELAPGGIK